MTTHHLTQVTLLLSLSLSLVAQAPAPAPAPKTTAKAKKDAPKPKEPPMITTETGLKYIDTEEGKGPMPARGSQCKVHYTGYLSEDGKRGKKFDSSVDRGQPLAIPIGVGRVIKGWDEGIMSMRVGGRRTLIIPAHLGYGARGAGGAIPPNAELIFDVELIAIQ